MRDRVRRAVLTRIVCALALFVLGFAGHAEANPGFDPHSPQYLLPDGTYSSLCQPGGDKGGLPHSGASHCDSCVTAAGHAFTPPGVVFAGLPGRLRGEAMRIAETVNLKRILSHHGRSRAPPLSA